MTHDALGFSFDNSYGRLPDRFHVRLPPTPARAPRLVKLNAPLAEEIGLARASIDPEAAAAVFSGNRVPEGADPIAMAYAGHQFGHFVPQLGDGRAILLGEVLDRQGQRRDIQLKGAGRTPFSRGGDGRAALGPVLREYIVSEAMHSLGIPTTRTLAAVTTGEQVYRDEVLPGAILTRVAASHIRVGTFEYFAVRGDVDAVRHLADHVIERHYPDAREADRPHLALLEAVMERQAALIARWMQVGFIHGVMNTDNTAVSGETIDYGPCAFMDAYDPATVFSSIDRGSRYAFANQPRIAQWNLARLAETLLSLIDPEPERAVDLARSVVDAFVDRFERHQIAGMRRKLGLITAEDDDRALIDALLGVMHSGAADFTLTFRQLSDAAETPERHAVVRNLFADPNAYDAWAARWQDRLVRDPQPPGRRADAMRGVNPAFIPRNHRVEQALDAAVEHGDFAPFEELLQVLSTPYEDQPGRDGYAEPPQPGERVFQTFCGT